MAAAARAKFCKFAKLIKIKNPFCCGALSVGPLPGGIRINRPLQHGVGGGSEKLGTALSWRARARKRARDAPEDVPPAQERRPADTPPPGRSALPPTDPARNLYCGLPVERRADRIASVRLPRARGSRAHAAPSGLFFRAAPRASAAAGPAAEARRQPTMPPKGDEDFVPKKKEGECVKVVVRVRPLSRKEIQDGHDEATKADEDSGRISAS